MKISTLVTGALLLGPLAAAAESPWRLGVGLGYGERSNPLILSDDVPVVVDLDIAWFGRRFFFDNGDAGYTLVDNETFTASIVGRFNSDRVFFGRTDTRFISIGLDGVALEAPVELEVPDRDYAIEAGVEVLSDGDWGFLQLAAHHDVSGTHDGYEVNADYGYGWRFERWYLQPSVGASFKSAALNDYYWGVRPVEASEALPAYEAGSGLNLRGRIAMTYFLSRQWAVSLVAEYERLNDEAAASPLVREQGVIGYFAGLRYRF